MSARRRAAGCRCVVAPSRRAPHPVPAIVLQLTQTTAPLQPLLQLPHGCNKHSTVSATEWVDQWGHDNKGADTDAAACGARAADHFAWCENAPGTPGLSRFYGNGDSDVKVAYCGDHYVWDNELAKCKPTGCWAQYEFCPNHPEYADGKWHLDAWGHENMNADTDAAQCAKRAENPGVWCGTQDQRTSSIFYGVDGNSKIQTDYLNPSGQ